MSNKVDNITYLNRPEEKKVVTKTRVIVLAVILAVLVVGLGAGYFIYKKYTAETYKIIRIVGTAESLNSKGKTKVLHKDKRFNVGDTLCTKESSLATVAIDNYKFITLEENSKVRFDKENNELKLKLITGGLFYNIKQPLTADEKLEVYIDNMSVNLTDGNGYFSIDRQGEPSLVVTQGTANVTATNPDTGETKQIDVVSGERLSIIYFNDRETDTLVFLRENITEEQLPALAVTMITKELALMNSVCAENGWDSNVLLRVLNGTNGYMQQVEEVVEETIGEEEETTTTTTTEATEEETTEEETTTTEEATPTPTKKPKATKTPTTAPSAQEPDSGNNDPDPTATPKPQATATATPKPKATATATPTAKPKATATPTAKPKATATPTPKPTATNKPSPTPTKKPSPTVDNPSPTVDKPSPTVDNPTPTVDKPSPTVDNPTPTVDNPSPTVDNPSPTVDNPSPTVDNPTDQPTTTDTPEPNPDDQTGD